MQNLAKGIKLKGSPAVQRMRDERSTQIALRLPHADLEAAKKLAERKGVGYQTLIKMILHERLQKG
jgi:predicted DNA binding CopG/RHH family protein